MNSRFDRRFLIQIENGIARSIEIPRSLETQILNGLSIKEIDLSYITNPLALRELSLAHNQIATIDLNPIMGCRNLQIIQLNDNQLEMINLKPFREFRELRYLNLANNHLTRINLNNLAPCHNLRELYLHGNNFEEINLTPLASCHNLRVLTIAKKKGEGFENTDSEIDISPLVGLRKLKRVDISPAYRVNVGILDVATGPIPQGLRKFLDRDKKKSSKSEFKSKIIEVGFAEGFRETEMQLESLPPDVFISTRKALLEPWGLEHLRGFDGNLGDLFENLDEVFDKKDPGTWRNQVNQNAAKAIDAGSSTVLIDIGELTDEQAGHFILKTSVLQSREREYQDIRFPTFSKIIDLREAWYTAWGFRILSETRYWIFTTSGKKTMDLRDNLRSAGLEIRFDNVGNAEEWPEPRRTPCRMIRRYIHHVADTKAAKSLKNPPLKLIRSSRNPVLQRILEDILEETYIPPEVAVE